MGFSSLVVRWLIAKQICKSFAPKTFLLFYLFLAGDTLVRVYKDIVQNEAKEKVVDLLRKQSADTYGIVGVLREPLAPSIQMAESLKNVMPGLVLGYCGSCPADQAVKKYKDLYYWKRHLSSNHKVEKVSHKCDFCGFSEDRNERLIDHMCNYMHNKLQRTHNVIDFRMVHHKSKVIKNLSKQPLDEMVQMVLVGMEESPLFWKFLPRNYYTINSFHFFFSWNWWIFWQNSPKTMSASTHTF